MSNAEQDKLADEIYNAVIGDERVQDAWTCARDRFTTKPENAMGRVKKQMRAVAKEKGFDLTPELIEVGRFEDFWNEFYM